jgi:hypothetical protein
MFTEQVMNPKYRQKPEELVSAYEETDITDISVH